MNSLFREISRNISVKTIFVNDHFVINFCLFEDVNNTLVSFSIYCRWLYMHCFIFVALEKSHTLKAIKVPFGDKQWQVSKTDKTVKSAFVHLSF